MKEISYTIMKKLSIRHLEVTQSNLHHRKRTQSNPRYREIASYYFRHHEGAKRPW